jgi:phosphopantetheinyl transferase
MDRIQNLIHTLTPAPDEARVFVLKGDDPLAELVRAQVLPEDLAGLESIQDRGAYETGMLGRGLMRLGAAAVQGCSPSRTRIERDAFGRANLIGLTRDQADLNISKRDGCVAIVVSRGGACGIDIECLHDHVGDQERLGALRAYGVIDAGEDSIERALTRWCGYEACLKADGRGMALGLSKVRAKGRVVRAAPCIWGCEEKSWSVQAIPMPDGFVGVVGCALGLHVVCAQAGALMCDR